MIQKNSKWWNNKLINKRCEKCPGPDFIEGRLKYKRKPHSQETLKKISDSLSGKSPWNKGKKGIYSDETIKKMQNAKIGYKPKHSNKGNVAWNKGLSVDDDRVKSYVDKQTGKSKTGNYVSGECHPNYNPNRSVFEKYRQQVSILTEKTYVQHKEEINPNNHPRTLCGVEGGFQLDHIISVKKGFNQNLSPKDISNKSNLQMLPWKINRDKSSN
jgi:hypothetical protein